MIQEQKYNFAQIKSGTRKVPLSTKQSSSVTDKKIVAGSGTMSDTDFTTFINKLADNLSITLTPDKIKYFQAQRAVENTRAKNNPFATTWPGGKRDTWSADPDMTRFNSVGVKNFSNLDAGVKATADTLRLGHYTDLLNALRSNEDMAKKIYEPGIITALNKWGGGSYAPKIQSRYKSVRDTIPIKDKTDKPSAETEIDVDNNKGEKKDTIDLSLTNIRLYEKRLRFYSNVIYKAYDYWFDRLTNWEFGYDYYSPTEVANYIASTYNKKWLNNPNLLASLTQTKRKLIQIKNQINKIKLSNTDYRIIDIKNTTNILISEINVLNNIMEYIVDKIKENENVDTIKIKSTGRLPRAIYWNKSNQDYTATWFPFKWTWGGLNKFL